jgi:hypothetical protein
MDQKTYFELRDAIAQKIAATNALKEKLKSAANYFVQQVNNLVQHERQVATGTDINFENDVLYFKVKLQFIQNGETLYTVSVPMTVSYYDGALTFVSLDTNSTVNVAANHGGDFSAFAAATSVIDSAVLVAVGKFAKL